MSEIKMSLKECGVVIEEMEEMICFMWKELWECNKVEVKGLSRKEMVMSVLVKGGLWSVKELSVKMGEVSGKEISSRNVSSLLSYVRDEVEKNEKLREDGKEGWEKKINKVYDGRLVRIGRGVGKLKWEKN